jgi:hypothetical protein
MSWEEEGNSKGGDDGERNSTCLIPNSSVGKNAYQMQD